MKKSLATSFLLHVMVLLAGMIVLPSAKEYTVEKLESVPIDLVTISEFTKLRAQKKDEKPEPEPEPPKPEKAEEKPEPEPEARPEPKPQPEIAALPPEPEAPRPPEPVAPEQPKPEARPEPEPAPAAKPQTAEKKVEKATPAPRPRVKPRRPRRPPVKKRRKFDVDRIAALLNKVPDANSGRRSAGRETARLRPGEVDQSRGTDALITMDERAALRAQIERCWNPPIGVRDAQDLLVRLRIRLKPDGSLESAPQIVNKGSSQYFQVAAESAMRAIRRCQPFTMPPEKYRSWREIIVNFDPREMIQG